MPDKDLIKFIVRILVTSWSTRRFRIFEYHVPVIPESVVHKWHCLVGVLRDQVCRFACLGTKILVIILQSALSFRNDLIYFDSICIWSSWVAAQRNLLNLFQFHLRRQRGDAHLNAEAEGAHPQSFRRGHPRPEGMTPWPYPTGELWKNGMYFAGLMQNHVTHQKQHLYAKPCGAYDGYYMLSPCNYALPNPASQWQHWSLAVNVDTVLTTYHILHIYRQIHPRVYAHISSCANFSIQANQFEAMEGLTTMTASKYGQQKDTIRYHGDSLCLLLPESSWKA